MAPSPLEPSRGIGSIPAAATGSESAFLRDARRRGDSRVCMRAHGNPTGTTGRRRAAAAAAVAHGFFSLHHACLARYGLIIRRLFERQQVVHPVPCYGERDSYPEPPIAHSLRFNCLIINLQPAPRFFMLGVYGRFCRVVTLDGINYHNDNGNNGCNDISPSPDAVVVRTSALSPRPPPTGRGAVTFAGACVLKCVSGVSPCLACCVIRRPPGQNGVVRWPTGHVAAHCSRAACAMPQGRTLRAERIVELRSTLPKKDNP